MSVKFPTEAGRAGGQVEICKGGSDTGGTNSKVLALANTNETFKDVKCPTSTIIQQKGMSTHSLGF